MRDGVSPDARDQETRHGIAFAAALVVGLIMASVGILYFPESRTPAASVWVMLTVLSPVIVILSVTYATRYIRRECGCLLDATKYGFETVESEHEWRRTRDGGKVRWEQYRTEMRRCEKCGDHYHTDLDEPIETREMWPEDEPEQRPESADLEAAVEV